MKKKRSRSDAVAAAPLDWLATWAGYFGYSPRKKRRRPNRLRRDQENPVFGFQLLEARFALTASPILLRDINPGAGDSSPAALAAIGSTLYFTASDGTLGSELWKSDGTAAGTVLVADINTGALGSSPRNLTAVGSTLYFTANNGTSGSELWKSDGTAAGTVLVKDINPGIADSAPGNLTLLGSTIYFTANNGTSGSELWKSDGTAAGTVLVKDIYVGADSSKPRQLTAAGSTLYFIADESGLMTAEAGSSGELWKTDGTTNGTSLLKAFGRYSSFIPGTRQAVLNDKIDDLTAVGSTLFFKADDGTSGWELWKTGGTPAGTVLVKDINPGTNNSLAGNLTAVGSTLYLTASDGISGVELWKSDGTAAGTLPVKDINPGAGDASPSHLTAVGSKLYFTAKDGTAVGELWTSDGTAVGTTLVKTFGASRAHDPVNGVIWNNFMVDRENIDGLTAFGSTLYFTAKDAASGWELWTSDGSASGTVLVKDINPGTADASPQNLTAAGQALFFTATNGTSGRELWSLSTATSPAPSVAIDPARKSLKPGDATTCTLTLSAPSTTFTAADVFSVNGAISNFTALSSTTYTCTFTAKADFTGTGYVVVYDNTFTDAAGNGNKSSTGSVVASVAIDTTTTTARPTIAIQSSKASLKAGETAVISYTLSAPSGTFTVSDLYAVGGTLSGFRYVSGTTFAADFTPTPNSKGTGYAVVYDNAFTDAAGNGNVSTTGAVMASLAIDAVRPTIAIQSNKAALKAGETAVISYTLSEPSGTFTVSDLYAVGGTLSGFRYVSGTTFAADFTPTPNSSGTGYAVVYDNAFTDAAGNGNSSASGAVVASLAIDAVRPTISIQSSKASLKAGETAVISYTLSEPSGTFTASDLYAVGGTLSGFRYVSGTTFAADFTPTTNSKGTGYAVVYDNAFTDAAGNGNSSATGAVMASLAIDAVRPTISIQSNKAALKAGETAVISYTLSEPTGTFTVSDLYAVGGTLSGFRYVSGTTFAADFTPTTNSKGTGYAVVYDNAFTDAAGNGNSSATGAVMASLAIDAVRPTISIQSSKASLKAGETAVISYTLSEPTGTFTASDLYAVGGTLSGFRFVSGTTFAADFTPTPNSTGTGYAVVYDNAFTDAAGNGNTSATGAVMASLAIDAVRPTISIQSSRTSLKAGETAVISYTLSEPSGTFTASDLYAVGGTLSGFRFVSGTTFAADFTPTPNSTATGTVVVYDNAFTDAAGNGNTSASGAVVVPLVIDAVRPTISIKSSKTSLKAGETAVISYTLSEPSGTFTASDLYAVGGTLSGFRFVSGTTFAADFTATPDSTGTGYAVVYDNAFTDAAGNGNTSASGAMMTTLVIDAKAPTATLKLDKTSVKAGDTATVTVQLSEPTATFTLSDLKPTGGTLSTLAYIGNNAFTAIFTPAANTTTTGSISLNDDAFTDVAGNGNRGPGGVVTVPITVDTVAPTAAIQSSKSSLKAGDTATVTVTLSEPSTTFTAADLYPVGGTLAAFTAVSSTVYTATFTPTDKSMNTGYVVVYDGAFTDLAGNPNKSSGGYITATMQVDTIVPTITLRADKQNLRQGEAVSITFILSEPSTTFTADDVTLSWGGTLSGFTFSGGTTYRATLTPNPDMHVEYVTVEADRFTDAAGNGNQRSEELRFEIDSVPPSVTITGFERPLKQGESTTLTFQLSEASETFTASDIYPTGGTVSNFRSETTLSRSDVDGDLYTTGYRFSATFTATAATETVGYVAVYDNTFTDAAGNGNKSDAGAVISYVSITSGPGSFDPSGDEQEVMEHVNRMRMNPQGELGVLFTSLNPLVARDPDADNAVRQYKVSSSAIQSQWKDLQPAQPVAWNESLYRAALGHNQAMIKADAQEHQLPGELSILDRAKAAGYTSGGSYGVGENIYAYAKNPFYAHSGFAIDWGVESLGHRLNIMNASYREAGIGILRESNPNTKVGPLVVTQNFGSRSDQTNSFLVGAIYTDRNSNGRYDSGEGLGGVNVQIVGTGGTFTTSTMTAGGYQMALPAGTYTVRAVGGGVLTPSSRQNVVVGDSNVKVDFKV